MIRPAAALSTLVLIAGLALSGAAPSASTGKGPTPWKPGTKPAPAPAAADTFQDHELDLRQNIRYINGLPDTEGVFLPDTTVLARVDDHVYTARDFVETYYNAYAPDRPGQDSLGRVDWLNSMVNKDVLGRVARAAAAPLTFEDRATLRANTERVLSNVLFLRAVLDSADVAEPELVAVYRQFPVEHHVRRLYFGDPVVADQVWHDLKAKKLTWEAAAKKFSLPQPDAKPDGDIGWANRMNMTEEVAQRIYALAPGGFTPVTEVAGGYYIYQSLERRRIEVPPYNSVRRWIYDRRRLAHIKARKDRLQAIVKREIGLTYDTTNVVFASKLFKATVQNDADSTGAPNIRINVAVPVFRSADTSRVVARWQGGQMTIAGFLGAYSVLPPLSRPVVNRLDLFCNAIDTYVLEPYNAELARRRGLERDPVAVRMIEKERERLMVEHMYQDSIESRIQVSPAERRKFYQEHLPQFFTYTGARYAQLQFADSVQALAVVARLRAGETAEAILRADSIAGRPPLGRVKIERDIDHGEYHRLLYEEMKPGQYELIGPDRKGQYRIVQMLSFDPGHQLTFEESDGYAYDAIAAQKSEDMLNAMIARHRARFRIETRPELVGRIRLVDPATDER